MVNKYEYDRMISMYVKKTKKFKFSAKINNMHVMNARWGFSTTSERSMTSVSSGVSNPVVKHNYHIKMQFNMRKYGF